MSECWPHHSGNGHWMPGKHPLCFIWSMTTADKTWHNEIPRDLSFFGNCSTHLQSGSHVFSAKQSPGSNPISVRALLTFNISILVCCRHVHIKVAPNQLLLWLDSANGWVPRWQLGHLPAKYRLCHDATQSALDTKLSRYSWFIYIPLDTNSTGPNPKSHPKYPFHTFGSTQPFQR